MRQKRFSAMVIGLAWMVSLGVVFILGVLSAFAFHVMPGAGGEAQADLSLDERDLLLTLERYTGEAPDIARLKSVANAEALPPQLEQTLRAILRLADREERQMAATRLVRGLPNRRMMSAIRFLQTIPGGPARDQVLGRFLDAWAENDGRSAMGFALSLQVQQEQQLAIQAVLRGWSRRQPAEAWNWVTERAGTTQRAERWLEIILSNLGGTDRPTAFALVNRLPTGAFKNRMAAVLMDQILLTETPREALKWLSEAPPGAQAAAAGYLAEAWAVTEPEAAAQWLRASYPQQIGSMARIIGEWVYADPKAGADWVWNNYSGEVRRELLGVVAGEWIAQAGPAPLADWLNFRAHDPSLDGAIEQLALATVLIDPATALVWAQSVADADARGMLEILISREWLRTAPDAAAAALPVLLVSEEARAVLLEPEIYPEQDLQPVEEEILVTPQPEEPEPLDLDPELELESDLEPGPDDRIF